MVLVYLEWSARLSLDIKEEHQCNQPRNTYQRNPFTKIRRIGFELKRKMSLKDFCWYSELFGSLLILFDLLRKLGKFGKWNAWDHYRTKFQIDSRKITTLTGKSIDFVFSDLQMSLYFCLKAYTSDPKTKPICILWN